MQLSIEPCEYAAAEQFVVRLQTSIDPEALQQRATERLGKTHALYEADEQFTLWEANWRSGFTMWVEIVGSEIKLVGTWGFEDPEEALDHTRPPPQELTLSDRLEIAQLVKRLIH